MIVVEELAAYLGIEVDEQVFLKTEKLIASLETGLLGVGAAMGIVATAIGAVVHNTAETGFEIAKAAEKTGTTTEALQELRYAAEQSGVGAEALDHSLVHLSRAAYEASTGSTDLRYAFAQLGVSIYGGNGHLKDSGELFKEVAESMSRLSKTDPKRQALAMQLFSRSGAELLPVFAKGRQGLADYAEQAHEFGVILDSEAIENSKQFIAVEKNVTASLRGLAYAIGEKLLPGAGDFAARVALWVKTNREWIATDVVTFARALGAALRKVYDVGQLLYKNLWAIEAILGYLATVAIVKNILALASLTSAEVEWGLAALVAGGRAKLAGVWATAAAVAPLLAWAALGAAIYLIADDVDAFFKGEDSLLGRYGGKFTAWLDSLLVDHSDDWWLLRALKAVARALTDVQGTWQKLELEAKGDDHIAKLDRMVNYAEDFVNPSAGIVDFARNAGTALGIPSLFGGGASPGAQAATSAGQSTITHGDTIVNVHPPPGIASPEAYGAATSNALEKWWNDKMAAAHAGG